MTPDVVLAHSFDAVMARKYFIVCVPTTYGKLFPRLICCPDHQFFDPFHLDGCVLEHPVAPFIGIKHRVSNIIAIYFAGPVGGL